MNRRKVTQRTQYERPVAPIEWGEAGRKFVDQICRVFDDIFRRYGRFKLTDLDEPLRAMFSGISGQVDRLQDQVEALLGQNTQLTMDALPVGTWMMWSSPTLPSSKWMIPQGQSLSLSTHPAAYALFGSKLPDIRGRVPVGHAQGDKSFGTLYQSGGQTEVFLNESQMPAHSHGISALSGAARSAPHAHTIYEVEEAADIEEEVDPEKETDAEEETEEQASVLGLVGRWIKEKIETALGDIGGGEHSHHVSTVQNQTTAAGQGTAVGNLQPYLTVQYIVKVLP